MFFHLGHGIAQRLGIIQQDEGLAGQVIEQAGGGGVEEGQVELRDGRLRAGAGGLVGGAGGGQVFAGGGDDQTLCGLGGALGGGIKMAQGVDLVAEELDAGGLVFGGRPKVEQAAAAGELARGDDGVDGFVPKVDPQADEFIGRDDLAGLDAAQGFQEVAPGQGAGHHGAGGGDDDGVDGGCGGARDVIGGKDGENGQAVAAGVGPPGGVFIEEGVGFREEEAGGLWRPHAQLVYQGEGVVGAVGEQQDGAVQAGVQGGKQGQARRAAQAKRGDGLGAVQGLQEVGGILLDGAGQDGEGIGGVRCHKLRMDRCCWRCCTGSWLCSSRR